MKIRSFTLFWLFVLPFTLAGQTLDLDLVHAEDEFRWGVNAFHNGYYNEAIVSFQKALSYKPQEALYRLWLGRTYIKGGYTNAAVNEMESVMASGFSRPYLLNLIETMRNRRGLGKDVQESHNFVLTGELNGILGEDIVFKNPTTVFSRQDGTFFINAYGSHEIIHYDINGNVRNILRGGIEGFNYPFDILEDENGRVYVSEFMSDKVAVCDQNGNKIFTIGDKGRGEGQFLGPQFMTFDSEGYLYVSDWGNKRVSKFDREGKFILSFGNPGLFYGGLKGPKGIIFLEDFIYVMDSVNNHIAVFDTSGNFINTVGNGFFDRPEGMELFLNNQFLIADGDRILIFDPETERIANAADFDASRIIHASRLINGDLIVTDFEKNKVSLLSDITSVYSGLHVSIDRINSVEFPEIQVDITVQDRFGNPVVGLDLSNFSISDNNGVAFEPEMFYKSQQSDRTEMVVMVEHSPETQKNAQRVGETVEALVRETSGYGSLRLVSASEFPALEAAGNEPPAEYRQSAIQGTYSTNWSFDSALNFSVTELLNFRGKRTIVFVGTGFLPQHTFSQYELDTLLDYMIENDIVFHCITLEDRAVSEELQFLIDKTGGASWYYYAASGIKGLTGVLNNRSSGRYSIRYFSQAETEFGKKYIPLSIETTYLKRSGRDEMGYFAPLEF